MPVTTKRLETPFGYFEVLKNGNSIEFSVEEEINNALFLEKDHPVHPDGCYMLQIETGDMKPGDVIVARYSVSGLEYDGGSEHTLNAVAELESYTIGIGCDDIDELEDLWKADIQDEVAGLKRIPTVHMFPYCFCGITDRGDGFEFRIKDHPKKYLQYSSIAGRYSRRTLISISLVWNKNADAYAWEIVSFLTC